MLLSKMHFALELSAMGYQVYFVNPPAISKNKRKVEINSEIKIPNIQIIDTKVVYGSLFFRHKLFFIYRIISAQYVKAIKKIVGEKITEVWCFNPQVYVNLTKFDADKTLLLLYDFYMGRHVSKAAQSADYIISVSQMILDYYKNTRAPKLLLQHGLGKYFAEMAEQKIAHANFSNHGTGKIRVGYTGNLLIAGMDIGAVKNIIGQHQDKEFHFWGPFDLGNSNNISSGIIHHENKMFIEFLQKQDNVFLHGVKSQCELAKEISEMDAFLLFYSMGMGLSKASNSHKILEYLSTGKVVICNYLSSYAGNDLLLMVENENLPGLFNKATDNLSFYNNDQKQKRRIEFALENTYLKQVERIHQFIYN